MTKSNLFKGLTFLFALFAWHCGNAQSVPSSEIYHQLQELKETRRVLYVAAHPDDENTRLIAYLANGENLQVAYLSLTRGDGGQNLIGKELSEKLGQIRTQELLQARKTDGGRQFFTRAIDFGYTKTPDETFQNWDRKTILSDVVWVIRNFQPDIIITRFNTVPGGGNHGQHTTSAILAGEALEVAADPRAFPEQLKYVKPWKAKRVFWNTYNFRGEFTKEPGQQYFEFPTGDYNPLIGESYSQIAADSRTMHKSQGFGSTASTGSATDHIQFVAGEPATNSAFDGVKNRWEGIPGGKEIETLIEGLLKSFDFKSPENNLDKLLEIKSKLAVLNSNETWVKEKIALVDEMILSSLGVTAEWNVNQELGYPGQKIATRIELTNPTNDQLQIKSFKAVGASKSENKSLKTNESLVIPHEFVIPADAPLSQPYWLKDPTDGAVYHVSNQLLIGKPFENDQLKANLELNYAGQDITIELPLMYKFNSPVDGEVQQPFTIVPQVDIALSKENVFLLEGADQSLEVTVTFADEILPGKIEFENLSTDQFKLTSIIENPEQHQKIFKVTFNLPDANVKKTVKAKFVVDSQVFDQTTNRILYSHIPNLTYFSPASVNLIKEDWKISSGARIGYIPGAGDEVPEVLASLGYEVSEITSSDYSMENLAQYKAIVVGIRAYNTNEDLVENQQNLLDYVNAGGNMIVQYNTTAGLKTQNMGPYPFQISRDRVTVENSPYKVDWSHPVVSSPNQFDDADFDGWVQERGLYFVTNVSQEYSAPLQFQDPDEPFLDGSLIFTNYGKGHYVYTSISFFRELPAGVPGAIKLFINLIEQ